MAPGRGVDNETQLASLNQIDRVWPAFIDLKYSFYRKSFGLEGRSGSTCREKFKSKLSKLFRYCGGRRLIPIIHTDKQGTAVRNLRARGKLRFCECLAKRFAYSYDLPGRAHFRSQGRINAREFHKWENRTLDEIVGYRQGAVYNSAGQMREVFQLFTQHQTHC